MDAPAISFDDRTCTAETLCATRASRPVLVLAAIVLLAGLLRLPDLDRQSRHGDEYMQTSCYTSSFGAVLASARSHCQPPLDYVIGWTLAKIDGSVAMMRLPAALFGILSVAATFVVFAPMTGARGAAVAAALVALSPLHIRMSLTARPYTIFVLAWLATLWVFARALTSPSRGRMIALGGVGCVMICTNGLGPLACLTAMVVATATTTVRTRRYRAILGVLLGVGALGMPLLLYTLAGAREWTSFDRGLDAARVHSIGAIAGRIRASAATWCAVWPECFGRFGMAVFAATVAGLVMLIRRWRTLPAAQRCTWTAMLLSGPVFIVAFAVAVSASPMRARYGLFLIPVIAGLAGLAAERAAGLLVQRGFSRVASVGTLAMLLCIGPAEGAWGEHTQYTQCDWRGCARYLEDRVTGEDVIIVIEDAPLGEYQPPFWGKYDWPRGQARPLAEAAWTLATSKPHWQRLLGQTGRCYLVIAREVKAETREAYVHSGITSPPAGWALVKFRGIDLLVPIGASANGLDAVAESCAAAAELAFVNAEVRAIPLLLQGRVLEASGVQKEAHAALSAAWASVPAAKQDWFRAASGYSMVSDAR